MCLLAALVATATDCVFEKWKKRESRKAVCGAIISKSNCSVSVIKFALVNLGCVSMQSAVCTSESFSLSVDTLY